MTEKHDSMRMFSRLSLRVFLCLIFAVSFTATSNCTGGDNYDYPKSERQDKTRQQQVLSPANKMQITDNDTPKTKHKFKAQEVLIKFKPGTSQAIMEKIADHYKLEVIKIVSAPYLYLYKITGNESVQEVITALKKVDAIEYSEPNFIYELM
jgi:hypothetical protein